MFGRSLKLKPYNKSNKGLCYLSFTVTYLDTDPVPYLLSDIRSLVDKNATDVIFKDSLDVITIFVIDKDNDNTMLFYQFKEPYHVSIDLDYNLYIKDVNGGLNNEQRSQEFLMCDCCNIEDVKGYVYMDDIYCNNCISDLIAGLIANGEVKVKNCQYIVSDRIFTDDNSLLDHLTNINILDKISGGSNMNKEKENVMISDEEVFSEVEIFGDELKDEPIKEEDYDYSLR